MKLRSLFSPLFTLLAVVPLVALSGCGGNNDDDGSGQVRLVNATTDYASLDLFASDVVVTEGVVQGSVGSYEGFTHGDIVFKLKRADSGITSLATTRTVSSGVNDSLIAYSTGGTLRTVYVPDSEGAPTSGYAKLRVFNTSTEAGSVDMYITAVGGNLDSISAAASSIAGERFSSYGEITAGSYHLVVTGAGDKTDVRLDIPSIALSDQQVATLILTSTPGGVLVHGLLLNQRAEAVAQKNTLARVRVVAGVAAGGAVSVQANGVALASGITSPAIVPYTTMPAGAVTGELRVNGGTAIALPAFTAQPGADVTLMVLGTAAAPSAFVLQDNNKPAGAGNAKLRLVHGVNGLGGNATLTADYGLVASDIPFGQASVSASLVVGNPIRLEVTSPASAARLFLNDEANLQATKVYTVFMLGDAAAPVGTLVRDR